jgi:hypothetical protein
MWLLATHEPHPHVSFLFYGLLIVAPIWPVAGLIALVAGDDFAFWSVHLSVAALTFWLLYRLFTPRSPHQNVAST